MDERSEQTITTFLRQHYGFDRIPVPTEAFTLLIERDSADFDMASDLSDDTYEIFGVTLFHRGGKPMVKIALELWEQRSRSNRLRMTLAHEYVHYADFRIMPRFSRRPLRLMGHGREMSA